MAKIGRPRTPIAWDEFDKLCMLQCTLREIASWFSCTEDTIEAAVKRDKKMRFSEYYEQKSGAGKISLRRRQFKAAESGNVTMLIWLGKQWLRQSDRGTIDISTADASNSVSGDMKALSDAELYRQIERAVDNRRMQQRALLPPEGNTQSGTEPQSE